MEVLKRYGENSIVASICPKVLDRDTSDPNYGYNPAVSAIIERLKEKLRGRCLPRRLSYDKESKRVPCEIVEAQDPKWYVPGAPCPEGREGIDLNDPNGKKLDTVVHEHLMEALKCGEGTAVRCEDYRLCRVQQLQGPSLERCQQEAGEISDIQGYCYVAATGDQSIGNPALVQACRESERRMLRFVGDNVPAQGATVFIACAGDTFARDDDSTAPAPATTTGP